MSSSLFHSVPCSTQSSIEQQGNVVGCGHGEGAGGSGKGVGCRSTKAGVWTRVYVGVSGWDNSGMKVCESDTMTRPLYTTEMLLMGQADRI